MGPPLAMAQAQFVPIASPAIFTPPMIKGVIVHPEDHLKFDFIIDTGNWSVNNAALKSESTKLIKYFLTSLTVPDEELWVNLSPYEKERIIPENFGQTQMGIDLLTQDYILKKLTASLLYPEGELGQKFWEKIRAQASKRFGRTDIPLNVLNKIWIIPDQATVYEHVTEDGIGAYVVDQHLKVMLKDDYEAFKEFTGQENSAPNQTSNEESEIEDQEVNSLSTQIIKEILIPEIEREVNEGKDFSNLRQIYQSMILAPWYKRRMKETLLGQLYVNRNKVKGIDTEQKDASQKIYQQYLETFNQGVYNLIKEEYDPKQQQIIARQYLSGGAAYDPAVVRTHRDSAQLGDAERKELSRQVGVLIKDTAILVENADDELAKDMPLPTDSSYIPGLDLGFMKYPDQKHNEAVEKRRTVGGVTREKIEEARKLQEIIGAADTPMNQNKALDEAVNTILGLQSDNRVTTYLKREDQNKTGSYKIRAPVAFLRFVLNEIKRLHGLHEQGKLQDDDIVKMTVKTVSTGNHGKAATYAVMLAKTYIAKQYPHLVKHFNLVSEVTMGRDAKAHKRRAIKLISGEVRDRYPEGHPKAGGLIENYVEGENLVLFEIETQKGVMQIRHSDADVVAGYSVIADEALDQLEKIYQMKSRSDTQGKTFLSTLQQGELGFFSPDGSGGAVAGFSEASARDPKIETFSSFSRPADMSGRSVEAGEIIRDKLAFFGQMFVDGTAATPEAHALGRKHETLKESFRVTETDALYATALLKKTTGIIVEPTSGLALAALLLYKSDQHMANLKHAVVLLSSQNLDKEAETEIDRIAANGLEHIQSYFIKRRSALAEALAEQSKDPVKKDRILIEHLLVEHSRQGVEFVQRMFKRYVGQKRFSGQNLIAALEGVSADRKVPDNIRDLAFQVLYEMKYKPEMRQVTDEVIKEFFPRADDSNRASLQAQADMIIQLVMNVLFDASKHHGRAAPSQSAQELRKYFEEEIPRQGKPLSEVMPQIDTMIQNVVHMGVDYHAHVINSPIFISVLADFLKSALNVNMVFYDSSAGAALVEKQTTDWIEEIMGYDPKKAGTSVLNSGTIANLESLIVAFRNSLNTYCRLTLGLQPEAIPDVRRLGSSEAIRQMQKLSQDSKKPGPRFSGRIVFLVSDTAHGSVKEAIENQNIGTNNIIKVKSTNGKMDVDDLRDKIKEHRANGDIIAAVVAVAATTETGLYDPIEEIVQVAKSDPHNPIWVHVDGAYGAAVMLSEKYKHLARGIEKADSIVVDPHKLMYMPYPISLAMYKDDKTRDVLAKQAEYGHRQDDDEGPNSNRSLLWSRPFDIFKLWLTLKVMGTDNLGRAVTRTFDQARDMAREMEKSSDYERITFPETNQFTFRFVPKELREQLQAAQASGNWVAVENINRLLNELNIRLVKGLDAAGYRYFTRTKLRDTAYRREGEHSPESNNLAVMINAHMNVVADFDLLKQIYNDVSSYGYKVYAQMLHDKVWVLRTGGTIEMTGAQGRRSADAVSGLITEFKDLDLYDEKAFDVLPDSSNIGPQEREEIVAQLRDMIDRKINFHQVLLDEKWDASKEGGIVITAGTDTIEQLGELISLELSAELTFPIVITAANLPADDPATNGLGNFNHAAQLARNKDLPPGVYFVYDGQIHLASRIEKISRNGKILFESYGKYVGQVDASGDFIINPWVKSFDRFARPWQKPETKRRYTSYVEPLVVYPGMPAKVLEDKAKRLMEIRKNEIRVGLVVEGDIGTQDDKTKAACLRVLKEFDSILVADANTFAQWQEAGVKTLPPSISYKKANIKLAWLLRQGVSTKDITEEMARDYAGEMMAVDVAHKPQWHNYEDPLMQDALEQGAQVVKTYSIIGPGEVTDAVKRLDHNGGKRKKIVLYGFGDGNVYVGRVPLQERVIQWLTVNHPLLAKKVEADFNNESGKKVSKTKDVSVLQRLETILSEGIGELDAINRFALLAGYRQRSLSASSGSLEKAVQQSPALLARRLIKDALAASNPLLAEVAAATDRGIEVEIRTNVYGLESDHRTYEPGNMLLAVGVDSQKARGWEPVLVKKDVAMTAGENVPDSAMLNQVQARSKTLSSTTPVGGIDMDSSLLNLQIKRDDQGIALPLLEQPVLQMDIEGFFPIIINTQIIQNFPLMIGLIENQSAPQADATDTRDAPAVLPVIHRPKSTS